MKPARYNKGVLIHLWYNLFFVIKVPDKIHLFFVSKVPDKICNTKAAILNAYNTYNNLNNEQQQVTLYIFIAK